MADFLTRLVGRTIGVAPTVQPIIAPMYAPTPGIPGERSALVGFDSEIAGDIDGLHREHATFSSNTEQIFSEQEHTVERSLVKAPPYQEEPQKNLSLIGPTLHDELYRGPGHERLQGSPSRSIPPIRETTPGHNESQEQDKAVGEWHLLVEPNTHQPDEKETESLVGAGLGWSWEERQPHSGNAEGVSPWVEGEIGHNNQAQGALASPWAEEESGPDNEAHRPRLSHSPNATASPLRSLPLLPLRDNATIRYPQARHLVHSDTQSANQREAVTEPPAVVPTVQVTIGRIEVRATPPPTPRPQAQRTAPPAMSLDDYLNSRAKGGH